MHNSIKHDRMKNISNATVSIMMRALGALFLLNLYFSKRVIVLEKDYYGEKIDRTMGSNVFHIFVAPCEDEVVVNSYKTIDPITCVYKIVRDEPQKGIKIFYLNKNKSNRSVSIAWANPQYHEFIDQCTKF